MRSPLTWWRERRDRRLEASGGPDITLAFWHTMYLIAVEEQRREAALRHLAEVGEPIVLDPARRLALLELAVADGQPWTQDQEGSGWTDHMAEVMYGADLPQQTHYPR